jgi:hypothetical protein
MNGSIYNIYHCNGSLAASGSYNAGTIPAKLLDYVEETMQDEVVGRHAKRVDHRRKEFRSNPDGSGPRIHASVAGWPTGWTSYGNYTADMNIAAMNDMLASRTAWPMAYNVTNYATPPQRWGIGFTSLNENDLKEDCLEKARQLKADVLLNVVEANQMWPSVRSLSGCIGELAYHWGNIRKVVATASGAYLAWKFGISPILSDIGAIQKYLPVMKNDIDRHVKGDAMRFSSIATGTASIDTSVDAPSTNTRYTYQGKVIKNPVVRYVLVAKPKQSPYMSDFFKKADAVLSRFASSPASLAWELIPFSFVADWFVDIRGTLRALDGLLGHEPFEVVAFTRSYSYHVETTLTAQEISTCDGSTLWQRGCGTCEFKHYERIPVSTSATLPFWNPRFGKNQAGISAALIGQQLSKLR